MKFKFVQMTLDYAEQISAWKYDGYLKNIDMEAYFKSYDKTTGSMRGPGGCEGFAALNGNRLAGLFEFYNKDKTMEIGLALSPDLVGRGFGKEFVMQGIHFGIRQFNYGGEYIWLTVNSQNVPAIRAYEKAGFKEYKRESDEIEMHKYITR